MARIRTIKPEFFRHEQLQDLETSRPELRPMLVYAGLWTIADKAGRFEWRPRQIKLDILPFLEFDMAETLELLREAGLIVRYEVAGKSYGYIPSFLEHQRITGTEATNPPRFPEPSTGNTKETPRKQLGCMEREKEREVELERITGDSSNPILQIAQAYPYSKYQNEFEMPPAVSGAIIRAIGLEGGDPKKILEYTHAYAKSDPDPKFVMSPERFFSDPNKYRRDWTRAKQTSRFDQLGELLKADAEDEQQLEQLH